MARKPASEPKWQIVAIRKRGQVLGIEQAKDADAAIKVWVEQYDVTDPEELRRLAAYRLG
jgi:NAD(P)-dependent dehydrogenase (short-subunit alcohol dehydrogenase family)